MAKRYHQNHKDRMDERHGEEHHMERKIAREMSGHYEGHAGRRRQEMMDAGMIHEDHSAIANMPQNVMIKDWPKGGSYMPEGLDDTIRGVDRQMDEDGNKRSRHERPHKY